MGKPISLEKDLWKVGFDCLDHGLCITLPETNIAPENWRLKDDISFWDGLCSGAFAVSFRECISIYQICFPLLISVICIWPVSLFWFQAFVPLPLVAMARVHLENQLPRESDDDDTSDEAKLWEWGWGQGHGWFKQNFAPKSLGETVLRAQIFSKHVKVFQQNSNEALPGLGILSHTQVEKPVELRHTHPMRIYDDAFSTKLKSKLFWASCRQSTLFEMSFFSGFKLRFSCWW